METKMGKLIKQREHQISTSLWTSTIGTSRQAMSIGKLESNGQKISITFI